VKILLAGSLKLEFLGPEVRALLDEWCEQGVEFAVGDAPGMDRAFQRYLADRNYSHVTVYCTDGETRNNLGVWPAESVPSGLTHPGHASHGAKDRQMVDDANRGLMVWDGASKGTLANVIDLLNHGKPCHLFVEGLHKSQHLLQEPHDLDDLEARFPNAFVTARQRLASSRKRHRVLVAGREASLDLDWSGV
jgi:hypothetical protein